MLNLNRISTHDLHVHVHVCPLQSILYQNILFVTFFKISSTNKWVLPSLLHNELILLFIVGFISAQRLGIEEYTVRSRSYENSSIPGL